MTATAFILVVTAAVFHAVWNLIAKRSSGNLAIFWLGLCFASILLAPFAVALGWDGVDSSGFPFIAATGFIHGLYFSLLAAAYRHGDMSVVYPLARGSSVAGTAVAAFVLIEERISAVGAVGIGFVCLGILALGLRELFSKANLRAFFLALLVGATTTAYSIVDKVGVGIVNPVVYSAGLAIGTSLMLAPYVLWRYRDDCRDALRNSKGASLWIGLGSMGAYLIILFAFQFANASYVVAVREISIAVVAVLSVLVLKEPMTVPRGISILAIVAGVVLVKVA